MLPKSTTTTMLFSDLPHDILFLFLTEAATSSVDSLAALVLTSRSLSFVFHSNKTALLRRALVATAGQFLPSAIVLAKRRTGLDTGETLTCLSPWVEPLAVVEEAIAIHRDIVLFSRCMRAQVHLLRLDPEAIDDLEGSGWISTTYRYALFGYNAEEAAIQDSGSESLTHLSSYFYRRLCKNLADLAADAKDQRKLARIDRYHLWHVADSLRPWGLKAGNWEVVGEMLGVWRCEKNLLKWERTLDQCTLKGTYNGQVKTLLMGKSDVKRWWEKHRRSQATEDLLETWLEEHGGFRKL